MGARELTAGRIRVLIVAAIFVATGCVAGSPLASLIAAGGSISGSPPPSEWPGSGSPATSTSPGDAKTPPPTRSTAAVATLTGHLTASPMCAVETVPPDPACAPRPVPGATVIATDRAGREVARAVSNTTGFFEFALAPGTYKLTPQPMSDQMMRAPEGTSVTLGGTAPETAIIDFTYDTGIR